MPTTYFPLTSTVQTGPMTAPGSREAREGQNPAAKGQPASPHVSLPRHCSRPFRPPPDVATPPLPAPQSPGAGWHSDTLSNRLLMNANLSSFEFNYQ